MLKETKDLSADAEIVTFIASVFEKTYGHICPKILNNYKSEVQVTHRLKLHPINLVRFDLLLGQVGDFFVFTFK